MGRSLGKDVISRFSTCAFVSATREISQATLLSVTLVLTRMTVSRAHEPAETLQVKSNSVESPPDSDHVKVMESWLFWF